mmetsp:Transcript_34631/g.99807  ORF Transcript_34631/g.99807 Transcript_34631/m.99807 type:complete len:203 (-) Transcript_34631:158-766(-)
MAASHAWWRRLCPRPGRRRLLPVWPLLWARTLRRAAISHLRLPPRSPAPPRLARPTRTTSLRRLQRRPSCHPPPRPCRRRRSHRTCSHRSSRSSSSRSSVTFGSRSHPGARRPRRRHWVPRPCHPWGQRSTRPASASLASSCTRPAARTALSASFATCASQARSCEGRKSAVPSALRGWRQSERRQTRLRNRSLAARRTSRR